VLDPKTLGSQKWHGFLYRYVELDWGSDFARRGETPLDLSVLDLWATSSTDKGDIWRF